MVTKHKSEFGPLSPLLIECKTLPMKETLPQEELQHLLDGLDRI